MGAFADRLKKFVKTKFFIVAASVAVFLTVLSLTLSIMGRADIVKSGVNLVAYPFRAAASWCGRAVDGFIEYFTEFDRLREENESLRQQLEDALSKKDEAEVALEENKWLREFLTLDGDGSERKLIDAAVVGKSSGNYITTLTLNKGTLNGVKKGDAVITADGLVGYVSEVGLNYSTVSTIVNGEIYVGVIAPRSGALGTLSGDLDRTAEGICKITFEKEDADIVEGDLIVTSGVGSVYPYGIKIGRVISVESDPYNRRLTAYVSASARLDDLYRVMILSKEVASDG